MMLVRKQWAAFPKIGASLTDANYAPSEFAEITFSSPKFVASANQVAAFLYNPEEPPPPATPDGTWGGHSAACWRRPTVGGAHEELDEEGRLR